MSAGSRVLALDTATDACSVALALAGDLRLRHEVAPRQHQQRLFAMIGEVAGAPLASLGLDLIAYGRGPGSFTGLRIAAAAAQGLAYSLRLPVVGVPTLACQAGTALRAGVAGDFVLSTLDARIGEVYWALYDCRNGGPRECLPPALCRPGDLPAQAIDAALPAGAGLALVGSGAHFLASFPAALPSPVACLPELLPEARDLVPLALSARAAGAESAPTAVSPLYVQGRERWKKLPQQGRQG